MYTIYNTERKHNIEKWDDARERDFLAKQVKPVNKMEWMRSHLHALFSTFFTKIDRQTSASGGTGAAPDKSTKKCRIIFHRL